MKSRIFYASLIMMLLVWTVAFGVVLNDGPGAENLEADAEASGEDDYVEKSQSGWYWEYTTRGGNCTWSYTISAEAYAEALLKLDEWAAATAVGRAVVSGKVSDTAYDSASVSGTGTKTEYIEDPAEPDGNSDSQEDCFEAYEGICGDSDVLAVAQIEEGSGCWAHANAKASATVSLYEN